jgi:hypothetical protein
MEKLNLFLCIKISWLSTYKCVLKNKSGRRGSIFLLDMFVTFRHPAFCKVITDMNLLTEFWKKFAECGMN